VYPAALAAPGTEFTGGIQAYSGDTALAASSDGKLHALRSDGSAKWEFDAGSPVVSFFDASGWEPSTYTYLATSAGLVYKIEDKDTQAVPAWSSPRNLGSAVTADIWLNDGYLYIGTASGNLYKIDRNGNDAANWNSNQAVPGPFTGTPAIDNFSAGVNAVWIGSSDGSLHRLDNTYGYVTVSSNTSIAMHTSPYLVAGFFNPARNTHYIYFGDDDGYLRCRNSTNLTGTPGGWNDIHVSSSIRGAPVLDYLTSDYVYFGADDGRFYKADARTGVILWSYQTGGPIRTVAAIGDNHDIYFGSDDGCFYGLDTATGKLLSDRFPVVTGGEVRGSPYFDSWSFARARIYFGSNDGKIYCIELDY
jgi:outer membrane protein assembly factor BamB